jgi:hypothetical protein
MDALRYFNLGLLPDEAALGGKAAHQRRVRKRTLLTLLVYAGVWLGVLAQKLLVINQAGQQFTWANLNPVNLLVALVISTAIYPLVVPRVFSKLPSQGGGEFGKVLLQFCTAFQQGFFWQALLGLI